MKDRKCMGIDCNARLPLGQLYCDAHRPKHYQVEGPNRKLIAWEQHPAYQDAVKRSTSAREATAA